jgi:hypothetical protein
MKDLWGDTLTIDSREKIRKGAGTRTASGRNSIRSLAEAIILQSMEDMWSAANRKESVEFFNGEGFEICAELAGLGADEQKKIMEMLGTSGLEDVLER